MNEFISGKETTAHQLSRIAEFPWFLKRIRPVEAISSNTDRLTFKIG